MKGGAFFKEMFLQVIFLENRTPALSVLPIDSRTGKDGAGRSVEELDHAVGDGQQRWVIIVAVVAALLFAGALASLIVAILIPPLWVSLGITALSLGVATLGLVPFAINLSLSKDSSHESSDPFAK